MRYYLCILFVAVLPLLTLGHSIDNRQLKRIEPLTHVKIDIAPRTHAYFEKRHQSPNTHPTLSTALKHIDYDDILRLSFTAYNQTFYLHLEPNLDLFHPEAVTHHQELGISTHLHPSRWLTQGTKSAQNNKILVYKGHVIHPAHTENTWYKDALGVLNSEFYPYPHSSSSLLPSFSYQQPQLGWARIIIRHDLMSRHKTEQTIVEGAFKVDNELYHIKSTSNYRLVKRADDVGLADDHHSHMVIYRESDTESARSTSYSKLESKRGMELQKEDEEHQCGFNNLLQKATIKDHLKLFNKREEMGFTKTESGCPKRRKINYMGAAADCTYVKYYQSVDNAKLQIINDFNTASALFEETFNISLGLMNITLMNSNCPSEVDSSVPWNRACQANYSIGDRLSDFSLWRSNRSNDGAGLWHLMTKCATGVEVGLAWLNQLCNTGLSTEVSSEGKTLYVSGAGVSSITRDEWKIVAHEIAHGFGAIHDCSASDCPCEDDNNCQCCQSSVDQCDSSGYIMSSITNSTANTFSPCSINTICNAFPSIGTCLTDPGQFDRYLYQTNVCGNGIKEEGEECDTGGVDTSCCDAKTCKLKKNAVCEDTNDGCCHNCQVKPKNTICRPSSTACDVAEYCDGISPTCPKDEFVHDGMSCGDGLTCASGQCTSRDEQCLARGSVMNITTSCLSNNEECKLLCNAPHGEKCLIFSGNFIDGTPCGYGGRCFDGVCENGDLVGSSLLYLQEHVQVLAGMILAILLVMLGLCLAVVWFGCWRVPGYRERRKRRQEYNSGMDDGAVPYYTDKNLSVSVLSTYGDYALPEHELVILHDGDSSNRPREKFARPTADDYVSSVTTYHDRFSMDEARLNDQSSDTSSTSPNSTVFSTSSSTTLISDDHHPSDGNNQVKSEKSE
ncbi:Metallo-peptidase family M12-domain-containing protein [Mycotypha africana]|uniref:Metallo-peptidase family M12-domain-containing protein n=1 Tax=Mycotypha africana TaxID=64632 RepID=UPI0023005775|nr:Metallo-peptidase family M12-domain-containing protein [Mycotypha africana]KAI8987454.1 Metallo-peptidase family M12-domain-containing protein [Mycotypha africana]